MQENPNLLSQTPDMIRKLFALTLLLFPSVLLAQPGPAVTFRSLEIGRSAREAALAGKAIAIQDNDPNLALFTPSLLNRTLHNSLSFNYVNYFSDVNFGYAGYIHHLEKVPLTLSGSIRYADYGSFTATDEFFNSSGTFKASDVAVQFGAGYAVDSTFTVGASLRFIQSAMESYKSSGLAVDVAATYYNPGSLLCATLMISDMGFALSNYTTEKQKLPFNISFGVSKKLAKSPLRFSLVADNLNQWDLTYTDPNLSGETDPLTGQPKVVKAPTFANKLFRHIYGGTEIVFSKNFNVRVGYNYRRRQELKISDRIGTAGFSWGFGFRVSKFHLSYARVKYHLASPVNHFTISTNLSTFGKK
jgi:hypothetical protein